MKFRKATKQDIPSIMQIINDAKVYMEEAKINQWKKEYPNEDVISKDIENRESYVLEDERGVVGTAVISFKRERTYDNIREGKWLHEGTYSVIHRVAVKRELKGLGIAGMLIGEAERLSVDRVDSLRVDTHKDNKSMQRTLIKYGFTPCGIITLFDGSDRIAYEKRMKIIKK